MWKLYERTYETVLIHFWKKLNIIKYFTGLPTREYFRLDKARFSFRNKYTKYGEELVIFVQPTCSSRSRTFGRTFFGEANWGSEQMSTSLYQASPHLSSYAQVLHKRKTDEPFAIIRPLIDMKKSYNIFLYQESNPSFTICIGARDLGNQNRSTK